VEVSDSWDPHIYDEYHGGDSDYMGFVEEVRVYCDISGSHSGVAEGPSSVGYYAVNW
jgi:hypothetical protein